MNTIRFTITFRFQRKDRVTMFGQGTRDVFEGLCPLQTNQRRLAHPHPLDKKLRLYEREGAAFARDIDSVIAHGRPVFR